MPRPINVVMCWGGISGYMAACWRALVARPEVRLRVILFPSRTESQIAFGQGVLEGVPCEVLTGDKARDVESVVDRVHSHQPEVVVIPGWNVPACTALPRHRKLADRRFVMAMDTPRLNSIRQHVGRIVLGRFLSKFDRVMVPGERSWQYARFLRIPEHKIRRGAYGVDVASLRGVYGRRVADGKPWPRNFLYVGRYAAEKRVDVLMEAYSQYRRTVADPWPLTCCGRGPMAEIVGRTEGVTDRGFVQPTEQPALFEEHGVFVLASRFDPWPLVVVEACAAGLPVVCTEACGSAVELVRPYYNGLLVATDGVADLANALVVTHEQYEQLPTQGWRGRELAEPYSAELWAERWTRMFEEFAA